MAQAGSRETVFGRVWAMPSPDTFSIPPIASLLARYVHGVVVDPTRPQLEVVDPGAAAIVQRFSELAGNLPTSVDAYVTFNSQIQAVIVSLEKSNPRTAFQLAQIKLEANRRLYQTRSRIG